MKLTEMPPESIDWAGLPATIQAGASGSAAARSRTYGDVQLRVVEYAAGYVADHWCSKGHILFVAAGDLVIEHQDGSRHDLRRGMSWHVADETFAPHRVVCERGATVFIVD